MTKASDLFVKCLEAEGIKRIFGVPGEENADFMMSLQSSSIEFVLTRHEQGAAFMAAVHGRLTGTVGVCLGTLGPGATNLMTGVADGNMDRAPMLVITGQGATTRLHKESHQVMDVVDMFRSVTKWSQAVLHPDAIPEIVRKAVKVAQTEKPGAVHIEIAEDIAAMETDAVPLKRVDVRRPAPDQLALDDAWALISQAKRPLIIAGNGTIRTRASKALRSFCESTGIGVLMTFMAKGALDLEDSRCLFTIGMGQRDFPMPVVEDADVIITMGYDMVEYPPESWNSKDTAKIVHIDFIPAEVDKHYIPEVEVIGDLAHAIEELCVRAGSAELSYDFSKQKALREKMQDEFAAHADETGAGPITPQKAIADVRACLGPEDILLSGVGAHKMWVARHYQAHEPGTCLISNGFCSMGMPLPGAIGAALSCPGRKILGLAGDADFLMNMQEMETAARLGSDIAMLVWEDNAYGLIEWKQEQEFGTHTDLTFTNPDWIKMSESFGWKASRCDSADELQGHLRAALDHDGPALVVMPVDYSENMKLTERLGHVTASL
ncbi:acetolactate synthase large subunit [Litoreibacter roseus]|uniref:Acetolactate synthase n=1 Tax=Litoreibacter roseus TaxID=2601869 RepID=A0A6N6JIC1_9RHOB|nr:acetolactate synthase large subunit [Litoreibacter roseus]GFE66091.1 acetolactate synthase [Litoreibacter roseus]